MNLSHLFVFVLSLLALATLHGYADGSEALSPPLSLDRAKAVIAMRGGVGTIFADGDNRYLISRIEGHGTRRANVFSVEVEITPLPKHAGQ